MTCIDRYENGGGREGDRNCSRSRFGGTSALRAVAGLPVDLRPSNRGRNASLSSIGLPAMRQLNDRFAKAGMARPAFIRKAFERAATTAAAWSPPGEDAEAIAAWFGSERERLVDLVDMSDEDIAQMRAWSDTEPDHARAETAMQQRDIEQFGDLIFEIARKADKQASAGKPRPAKQM